MKTLLAFVILSVFAMSQAIADTPTIQAIGYENGLSYRINSNGGTGFQGVIGLGILSPADNALDSDFDMNIGANVFQRIWDDDRGNLNIFAGTEVVIDGTTTKDGDSNTDVNIVAGFEPEAFLSEHLSVSTKFGLILNIAGDRRGANDSGWVNFGTYGSLLGGAALNWYF